MSNLGWLITLLIVVIENVAFYLVLRARDNKYALIPIKEWEVIKDYVGNKLSAKYSTGNARCVA